ncbi:Cysteine desulfuration protein SufE [Gimesia panareensis]|uniref:Cysteine desulfuration protein SufE n=1 Tax=Gimesia panareensis TaxID=2527978 RepID=A0A518FVQ0_9PLAN|nr:SufE family protein [Gimesia panareensis]QDV20422.1 Cysteine desulfuration protein SufE [Gimesia panareensis]
MNENIITIDELLQEFAFLSDWEDRYDFVFDLGFELPLMAESLKTKANEVHGCQSKVWLTTKVKESGNRKILEIIADSDSRLVKGLIVVLLAIYQDKTPEEVLKINVKDYFSRLQLDKYLSPQRKNGLMGMVKRIQQEAIQLVGQN